MKNSDIKRGQNTRVEMSHLSLSQGKKPLLNISLLPAQTGLEAESEPQRQAAKGLVQSSNASNTISFQFRNICKEHRFICCIIRGRRKDTVALLSQLSVPIRSSESAVIVPSPGEVCRARASRMAGCASAATQRS